jgi:hypothetical protein
MLSQLRRCVVVWLNDFGISQANRHNRRLTERGVASIRRQWIEVHSGKQNEKFNPAAVTLTETA